MLAYAFQTLKGRDYEDVATESFDNVAELCATILSKGVSRQIRRGLGREYIERTEALSMLRGRIEVAESIKTRSIHRRQLCCTYDEFSVNSYMNQIIRATMEMLLYADVSKDIKKELRNLLLYFKDVESIDIHNINWNMHYDRNNQTYRMLISICYLVVKGLLQTDTNGATRLMRFFDEQRMSRLYEKFIYEYYKKEYPHLEVSASQIKWALDDDKQSMLPVMQSDVILKKDNNILIIDAKYYSDNIQSRYDKHTIHSANLFQIFTYVKNKSVSAVGYNVSGMLLYAATDAEVQPNNSYMMSGNKISAITLDLNKDFDEIEAQLKTIIDEYLCNV